MENVLSTLGLIVIQLLITFASVFVFIQKKLDHRIRRGWLILGLAALSNIIAESIWYYYETILGIDPFPSIADLFYLLFYPLTLFGVLLFPFKPLKRMELFIYFFDICIVMVTMLMIFWHFFLAPIHLSSEGGLEGVVALAYPVGDLLLFAAITVLIQRNTEKLSRWSSIFIALSVFIIALPDSYFAYYELNEIQYTIAYLNILWLFSGLFMWLAILKQIDIVYEKPIESGIFTDPLQRIIRTTLPYIAAATGPVLLIMVFYSSENYSFELQGLFVGTILLIALVLGRQQIVLMDNMRLYEEMYKLAITDSLTGLYNRHYFNEIFIQEIERACRYKNIFSVLLIDIDHFKMINDTFGHLKGDAVLKIVARTLAGQMRQSDILARFGGDEFIILLLETDLEGATAVLQKIENSVNKLFYANTPLNVSIGIASYHPGLTAEQLLEEADRQLYSNKQLKLSDKNITANALLA
ncbi:MAG: GGDEF domain-containing protein [Anaerolineales bacterium]|nr:GGDEF domain-containing protein [Anaerolineales bacterium]